MKRKGFTLVELLAVIVVLAIISIITIPMIGNVIDESKKKALEVSANGLVEAASYYTINHDGVTEFVFDENKKGETIKGEQLDYKGSIEGTGKLYIDQEGDISLCLVDDKYYVYKNYNSGIYVGEVKDNSCIIGYDVLTNKYVAMLDDGTGQISNIYSKDEVNNLIDNLQSQINTIDSNLESLSDIVSNNQNSINDINNILKIKKYNFLSNSDDYDLQLKDVNNVLYIDGTFKVPSVSAWSSIEIGSISEWNHSDWGDNFLLASTSSMDGINIRMLINSDGKVFLTTASESTTGTWVFFRNAYAYN